MAQCGCGAGQGCYAQGDTSLVCAAAGQAGYGQSCTSLVDCQPGMVCIDLSADSTSPLPACRSFCNTDADCRGSSLCVLPLTNADGLELPARACSYDCHLVTQTGCPSGAACMLGREPDGTQQRYFTDCAVSPSTAVGTQGQACSAEAPCAPGYVCNDFGQGALCHKFCQDSSQCAASETCYMLDPAVIVGSQEYGVCDAAQ